VADKQIKDVYYILVYNPKFDKRTEDNIEIFRRKYDSFVDYWEPHMSFVFPVPCSEIKETELITHIKSVLKKWKPFRIRIGGFEKSWDHWLLLLLKEGNEKVIALHDELYNGILSSYLRKDIEFVPHIGLALLVSKDSGFNVMDPKVVDFEEKLYHQALAEAESLKIDSSDIVDRLFLNIVILKGRKNELLYRLIDRKILRLLGGHEETGDRGTQKMSGTKGEKTEVFSSHPLRESR
jgi:2'-5' RNA ligase